jgi:hypothetical protein
MNSHPYLRAFFAGAFVPTLLLPILLLAFVILRFGLQIPIPIERGLVFPMALVPSLWALWNMLWVRSHTSTQLPIGLHGAILPFVLLPAGASLATCLGILVLDRQEVTWFNAISLPYAWVAAGFACALAAYYLVWKYVVGYLNRVLGIA